MDVQGRLLLILAILSSLFGYLKWGGDNSKFLFQMEAEVLMKLFTSPMEVLHPFVILPLFGQLLLLYAVIKNSDSRWLIFTGLGMLAILLGMILLIGILAMDPGIILSVIPFFLIAFLILRSLRKGKAL